MTAAEDQERGGQLSVVSVDRAAVSQCPSVPSSPYQDNNITARQSYKDNSAAAGPVIIISARSRLRADGVVTGDDAAYLLCGGWAGRPPGPDIRTSALMASPALPAIMGTADSSYLK